MNILVLMVFEHGKVWESTQLPAFAGKTQTKTKQASSQESVGVPAGTWAWECLGAFGWQVGGLSWGEVTSPRPTVPCLLELGSCWSKLKRE